MNPGVDPNRPRFFTPEIQALFEEGLEFTKEVTIHTA